MAVDTIGGGASMIKMMEEQGKTLKEHDKAINVEILPRLEVLEKEHQEFKMEVTSLKSDLLNVQKGQKELELTVMKDGNQTRDLLKPFADHVLKQAEFEAQSEKDIAIKRMDTREKIFLGIFGTGGVAGIIAAIVTFLQFIK
ncbi:hypothetical protein [Solibacillus sp. FSL W8-0372]|uniref:hypothetical protein n=1 Tax=Solibacillus sp. FSL W8-0372 TaxID=2921713 RepID=UPI0030CB2AC8